MRWSCSDLNEKLNRDKFIHFIASGNGLYLLKRYTKCIVKDKMRERNKIFEKSTR